MAKRALICLLLGVLLLTPALGEEILHNAQSNAEDENMLQETQLYLIIDGEEIAVQWEKNEAVDALNALVKDAPLEIELSMYGGFEQVGPLGASLPRNDQQTTTQPGDIVLYSGDQIVLFYGTNSWAYTRLGKLTGKTEEDLKALLGSGDISLTLTNTIDKTTA